MELEFLVVGIAKESREDLRTLYEKTAAEVFGLALAIVKDTGLAAEVLAETYRRIITLAYLFDTELSAEYWILDMAKNIATNALHDASLRQKALSPKQDNLSRVLMELINHSKNDRAAIMMVRCLSQISKKDIAKLLWYKTNACRKEYKRGLNRLAEKIPNIEKAQLPSHITHDIAAIVPDVWDRILFQYSSPLSHISHEELNLASEDLVYTDQDKEKAIEEKHIRQTRKKRRTIAAIITVSVIVVANIIVLLVTNVLNNNPEKPSVDVQFGNRIAIARLGNDTFYQNTQDENTLWIYSSETKESRQLLDFPIKELITDGVRLYYRNLADGYLYIVNPDGTENRKLTENPGTCMTLFQDKIYFSTAGGISRINLDGTREETLVSIDLQAEDLTYFSGMGLSPYRYMMKFSPESLLYFSAGAGKGIYYVTEFNGKSGIELVYTEEAYTFEITKDSLYFDLKSYDEDGNPKILLYRLHRETGLSSPVEGFQLGTGAFCIADGLLYFDGCVNEQYGLYTYRLDGTGGGPEKFSDLRASDLFLSDGLLYIYYPGSPQEPSAYLKYMDMTDTGSPAVSIF